MTEVNRNIPKIDGVGLLTGKAAYTDDLAPADALVVKVLRSPHAFARIESIETAEAEALPGVACVLTWKDVPRIPITRAGQGAPEPSPMDRFILDEYVRHVGDDVAVVAAETDAAADAALAALEVVYEKLEPVLDFEEADGHATVIHPEPEIAENFPIGFDPKRNIATNYEMHIGDVDTVCSKSKVVLRRTYYTQPQNHVALEPHASASWLDLHGRLNVMSSTQTPFHVRRIMARAMDLPLHRIRVFKPRVGGAFGGKQQIAGELFVGLVTMRTGRAAKIRYTRREVFTSTNSRHAMRLDICIAADRDGTMRGLGLDILSNTGAYGEHALTVAMVACAKSLPLYNRVEAVCFKGKTVYTNKPTAGACRGYGAIQGNFALEAAMNELAEELGMDPCELRAKNMIREGETSPIFAIMGEGTEGIEQPIESCKLDYCLERAKEMIGWSEESRRKVIDEDRVRGLGVAIAMQGSGIPTIDMASATIKLNDEGSYNLALGSTDLGTGSDTILAQMAAEVLGVTTEEMVVYASDTDRTPFDAGAYASSTTYVTGRAVVRTARAMRAKIIEAAAHRFGVEPDEVDFDGRTLIAPDHDPLPLAQMATELLYSRDQRQLAATESYVCDNSPPPYMAGVAEVEVDLRTGEATVVDLVGVVDCGTPINPNLAMVQAEGGLVFGLGMALYEQVVFSPRGGLLTANLMDYKIPTRTDVPQMRLELAESHEPTHPFGAKSIGEVCVDPAPAMIVDAVHAATGVWIRDLPVTPEKVLRGMKKFEQE